MMYLSTMAGFVLLFAGGEFLVRGSVGVARRFGISELLIGLTVVAFGTSAPELLVSVDAALAGRPDLAVGNVVGSNIANIALILGLAALVRPVRVDRKDVRPDALALLAASFVLWGLALTGSVERWQGFILFGLLVVHLVSSYVREKRAGTAATDWHAEEAAEFPSVRDTTIAVGLIAGGLVGLVFGADLLIGGATSIAGSFGVPDAVIGLTVVAIGTSLPELATSAIAAYRGHSDVAVGNVLGSNLFNILSILGITAMITPVSVSDRIAHVDIPIMVAVSAVIVAVLLTRGSVGRALGGGLFAGYLAYTAFLYVV